MAAQLAALFAFLQPSQELLPGTGRDDLALYADPTYWLYGLLSFCAKSCEAKTTEAGGEPDFKTSKERKQESTAPALEPTRNSLALMQTVVMSFARGLYLGKPELPIDHVHIYFPVQIVHKVTAQCEALKIGEVSLDGRKRYKHNVDNAANNPYVIVGVYEGRCSFEQYPPIPGTPTLARAYEEGILDASFGQVVSFASKDMTTVCMRASEFRVGSNAGAVLSCFLSLLVLKSGSPPASVVFASQLLAQKDRRPYSQ